MMYEPYEADEPTVTVEIHPRQKQWETAGVRARDTRSSWVTIGALTIFCGGQTAGEFATSLRAVADRLERADEARIRGITMDQLAYLDAVEALEAEGF
jgi:hypothetical protein